MRVWSVHPQYLDVKGLVALWRETLLAQKVLLGDTKGYKNHPQLERFKQQTLPLQVISNYLHAVCDEADRRGYKFNRAKIARKKSNLEPLAVTSGQINYEWQHFLKKIATRDNKLFCKLKSLKTIKPHPLFFVREGDVENWERI